MSLGTKLLASMSGEYTTSCSGPLRDEDRLLEPTIFSTEERKKQKGWWKKACCGLSNRLPVCFDFYYERVRNRFAFVCIAIQIYFYLVMESSIVLPSLGFDSLPNCAQTLYDLNTYDNRYDMTDEEIHTYNANIEYFVISQPAYLIFSSIALCSWNSPIWTILGAIMAIINLSFSSILNGRFCAVLANELPILKVDENGYPASSGMYPIDMILGYNLVMFSLTVIVSFVVVLLTMNALRKKMNGEKLFEQVKTGFRQPVIGGGRSPLPFSLSIKYVLSFVTDFLNRRVLAVPLRHVVASALSSTVLIAISSVIVLYIECFNVLGNKIWNCLKNPDCPNSNNDQSSPLIVFINGVKFLMTKYPNQINMFLINQIFGSLNDILTYAPYGIWLVAGGFILVILYSFYPISHQHEVLVKRYEGLQILKRNKRIKEFDQAMNKEKVMSPSNNIHSSLDKENDLSLSTNPPSDPLYHLAPDLRNAGHFSSYQYVISHVLTHVSIFFITCFLVALIVLGIMINMKGFQNVLPYIIASLNSQIFKIINTAVPLLCDYILLPLLSVLNIDPAYVFSPFRVVYVFFAGFFMYSDGPFVFSPRIMMFFDTVLSLTYGLIVGIVGAIVRIGISLFWGLFRTVIVWEPVVPVAFASLDMTYSAYCSMMKGAHIEFCDIEELGQEFPPITKKGAYESSANSVILKADAYGASVGDVAESEAEPLVVSA